MFANATLLFLNGHEAQIKTVLNVLQTYFDVSGCQLVLDKSEAIQLSKSISLFCTTVKEHNYGLV